MSQLSIDTSIFKKNGVKAAYLFGSRAKGTAGDNSDVDIAVLFRETPEDPLALKQTTRLSLELYKFIPDRIDVVSLHGAPLLLKYEVVAHGQPIYCENDGERINLEVSILQQYIDDEPVRALYNRALYKRILQGA